jgi:hypothetical protein
MGAEGVLIDVRHGRPHTLYSTWPYLKIVIAYRSSVSVLGLKAL